MFRRLLVANRGEVAARVVRTCRRLGIETVAVASSADRDLAWLAEADKAVCVGGAHPRDSYLHAEALLETAVQERCSALHPGWGFLSEDSRFAARCEALGISFLGPPFPVLRLLGDKVAARRELAARGLPIIPGSLAPAQTLSEAAAEAERIGYPVLLKALAGGGGRGQRGAGDPSELEQAYTEARALARSFFGDDGVYVEKLISGGRHVEFQLLADRYGNSLSLGERECSLQRKRQKLLEEAPAATRLNAGQRRLGERAAAALCDLGFVGAGTVEMLLDQDGNMRFMECNPRLQVEHGVTEAVTGVDLVEWQLRLAAGQLLDLAPVKRNGHAIQCRINAEDPQRDFRPAPGAIQRLVLPRGAGIRVDTHLRRAGGHQGADSIPPHYDSLICKIIAHGRTRRQAIDRMRSALRRTRISGVDTTISLHQALLEHPSFRQGSYHIGFLEEEFLPTWHKAPRGDAGAALRRSPAGET